jgi:hypothetical protein
MDGKDHSDQSSDINKEQIIRQWRYYACYEVAKMWMDYFYCAVESKPCKWWNWILTCADFWQSVEGAAWILPTDLSKMWDDQNELKMELLSKTEPELKYLQNSQPIYVAKNNKISPRK